ncbi:MAG: hypothetical protein ACYCY5_08890 [Sulfuricella sp.]
MGNLIGLRKEEIRKIAVELDHSEGIQRSFCHVRIQAGVGADFSTQLAFAE